MLFNSIEFLVFFVSFFIVYWSCNSYLKLQNVLILLASYLFYGWWDWRFLSLIAFSSTVDYICGLRIASAHTKKQGKTWLLVSLISNLGLLAVFKYYNFFVESFSDFMGAIGFPTSDLTLQIILPVGISFYTFQTLSYTIDIYRKELKPTMDVIAFFAYIAFFPQLVAGPIERASNLLPQIRKKRNASISGFNEGILQLLIGLFRKIVVADTIASYVDTIYADMGIYNSSTVLLATILYAFQIYFDFSGYSDIAIGTAKVLGFKFHQNFNLPYFSKSLTEFWRKWHMSLSYWLRDYLYISLGGNRKGIRITYRNLMLTMLLGGLWHGSSWNFIIWGGIHGVVLSVEKYLQSTDFAHYQKRYGFLGYPITFFIVLFAWIFFRAQGLDTAILGIERIFALEPAMPYIGNINLIVNSSIVVLLALSFDFYLFRRKISLEDFGSTLKNWQVVLFSTALLTFISLFHSTSNNFIYFQF